ncbi:protein involved in polysaccharide export with SLBB domain [Sphingomonas kyeonggiensis]|uniref:Protein involved in polysaccharide export with SLBB domain n=1 Tax=Sphingomonas kyeonggiensis TaxID=1268553 RepID=A0A7W7K3L0_9SPHN|nr:SLBB domain-containing protein [Sphingomonas kyeonggiensis]MBB4839725.1 protein involved in polysaccharide export with SLBB domain [Sphingomonas kyeonggiensis]
MTHFPTGTQRQFAPSRRIRTALTATSAALALFAYSAPAWAQTIDQNTPSGSPLSPGSNTTQGQSSSSQSQNQNTTSTPTPSTVYEPISVDRSGSGRDTVGNSQNSGVRTNDGLLDTEAMRLRQPVKPGEFESWARDVTGRNLKRFGSDLLLPGSRDFATPATSTIPPDYALNVGDTVSIALTGSMEGSVDAEIDRDGKIFLPNVGSVSLVGVRYRDLRDRIASAIGRKYRGYDVSVSLTKLRGVRVYVTGFAAHPGAYSVNSLSTLVNAILQAGGPAAGGSFRSAKLYRNGQEVADFDLYQLLRDGDRSHDPLLQNEDVIFIPAVGRQVAVIGSVNEEAIYEVRQGESLADTLRIAGGPTNLADDSRLILYRLSDQDSVGSRQIERAAASNFATEAGDIIQILPQGSLARPLERQQAIVRIEGEVNKPGNYYVAPNTPLAEVVAMAGGLTPRAYVYGTRFSRETVRAQQRRGFLDAVDQMEMALAAAPLTGNGLGDQTQRQAQVASAKAFLDQLRKKEPDGRLVLDVTPVDAALPNNLLVENNDRIVIPPRVETVGVFGAVYRPASFIVGNGKAIRVRDYVEQAGGVIRGADRGNIFVVRANGSVLTRKRGAMSAQVLPGDTIFVPIRTENYSLLAKIRDISQVVAQFGIAALAIAAIN